MPYRNEDHDRLQPQEYPEPDENSDDTAPCPRCHAHIYDDAVRCPACGHYLGAGAEGKPWWMVAGILLCLAMALGWVVWW
jgi:hypothetical protein